MRNSDHSPLITAIVPTYRRPHFLRRALQSVLSQTFRDFQVCVFDNHSGDETPRVVREFSKLDPRVRYFCHSKNIGALANFHFGMTQVKTPFFSLLMDDDLLLPECFQTAMEGFERFPDALFSGGSCLVMTHQGEIIRLAPSSWRKKEGRFAPPEGLYEMLKPGLERHLINTSLVFRREVFEKVGYMDFTEGVNFDIDYILRISSRFPFALSSKPCGIFIMQPHSFWIRQPAFPKYAGSFKMLRNVTDPKEIPKQVKTKAKRLLKGQIKEGMCLLAAQTFLQRRFDDTLKLADALKQDFKLKNPASLFKRAVRSSQKSPSSHSRIYRSLERKFAKPQKTAQKKLLQKRFGGYAKYLLLENS